MKALAAPSPWYCVVLRRASEWLAGAARRLEAERTDVPGRGWHRRSATEYVHGCEAAEERLREMRSRYY